MEIVTTMKFKARPFILLVYIIASFNICSAQSKEKTLHELNDLLINTVMDDVFTPTVSSRIYVYPNIAFYECIRKDDPSFKTLAGKLNGLKSIPGSQTTVDN